MVDWLVVDQLESSRLVGSGGPLALALPVCDMMRYYALMLGPTSMGFAQSIGFGILYFVNFLVIRLPSGFCPDT